MKVKMNESVATSKKLLRSGQEYELPDDQAKVLLDSKRATQATDDGAAKKPGKPDAKS